MNESSVYVVSVGTGCCNNQHLPWSLPTLCQCVRWGYQDIIIFDHVAMWLYLASPTSLFWFWDQGDGPLSIQVQTTLRLCFSTKPTFKLTPQLSMSYGNPLQCFWPPNCTVDLRVGSMKPTEVWKQFDGSASWETTELRASCRTSGKCQGLQWSGIWNQAATCPWFEPPGSFCRCECVHRQFLAGSLFDPIFLRVPPFLCVRDSHTIQ